MIYHLMYLPILFILHFSNQSPIQRYDLLHQRDRCMYFIQSNRINFEFNDKRTLHTANNCMLTITMQKYTTILSITTSVVIVRKSKWLKSLS